MTGNAQPAVGRRTRPRRGGQRRLLGTPSAVVAVIALGGGLGALARYGVSLLLPPAPAAFPWDTFTVNIAGCLLIGVLMVLISDVWSAHRLLRPFLGVGVLGGFTTFSAYADEIRGLLQPGTAGLALVYLVVTPGCAVLGVLAGSALTRWLTAFGRRLRRAH